MSLSKSIRNSEPKSGVVLVFATLVAISAGFVAPAALAQTDCKTVFDANEKLYTTPYHSYISETGGGLPAMTSETIVAGGVSYIQVKGKWRKSPMSIEDVKAQEKENLKNAKNVSCHYLRDESVNGEAAAVYSGHNENEDAKYDSQVWISKGKGLVLRKEEEMDMGAGDKRHFSMRFEYSNVQAPPL